MTELAVRQDAAPATIDPTGGRLVAWAQAARAANALATSLVQTSFAPKEFRGKPEEATAAILLGDELGLSPISALRSVYVIHGTPSIYAKTAVALVQAHGHEVWTESQTDREVIMGGRRKGSDRAETATWTIDRAKRAGYTSNAKYQSSPQEMLWAKAASEICKKIASDVLAGVPYTVEDLELEQPEPSRTVARKTVQRAPKPVAPEPEFDEPPAPAQEPVKATAERGEAVITDAQSRALHAALRDAGLSDRDAGLAYISQVIEREVDTTKALTKREASFVIDKLKAEAEEAPADPPLDGDWPAVQEPGA